MYGEGAPDGEFRAPTQERAEIYVYPGSTRMRNGDIALMAVSGIPDAAKPYLVGGGLSVLGGGILMGLGAGMLIPGGTKITIAY